MKNKQIKILMLIICGVFAITFYFGIFANPNFNIYDFCLNLSTEIIGMLITVILVDRLIRIRSK